MELGCVKQNETFINMDFIQDTTRGTCIAKSLLQEPQKDNAANRLLTDSGQMVHFYI